MKLDLGNIKVIERLLLAAGLLSAALFAAGYFVHIVFFYGFLICLLAFLVLWIGFWKCPHCGKRLWFNFDAPCRRCGRSIYEKPEDKPKNTEENRGFFGL